MLLIVTWTQVQRKKLIHGTRGSQEEQDEEKKKRVRFSEEEEQEDDPVGSGGAETTVAQGGGSDGAAVPGHKRKRDVDDEGGKGMDIDAVSVIESLGGMLSRISIVDPEMDHWAKMINEQNAGHVGYLPAAWLMATRLGETLLRAWEECFHE